MTKALKQGVTIHDVAREAKVSISTVSRVLNSSTAVNPEKSRRVLEAVKRLRYRPNPFIHGLIGRSTSSVGMLVPHLRDEYYGSVVTGIESELRAAGMHMLCALGHRDNREEAAALELFRERRVDGLILLDAELPDAEVLSLGERGTPLVLVSRFLPELADHCVRLDNVLGGRLATQHLLDLGHRRIAYITGPLSQPDTRARLQGYHDALRGASLEPDSALVLEAEPYNQAGARIAAQRLLGHASFTAVFASNDLLAMGIVAALHDAGVAVPKGVSVVGFDDRSIAAHTVPTLSTIRYPMVEMGERAARHLIALARGETPEPLPLLEPSLIRRASTAYPPSS